MKCENYIKSAQLPAPSSPIFRKLPRAGISGLSALFGVLLYLLVSSVSSQYRFDAVPPFAQSIDKQSGAVPFLRAGVSFREAGRRGGGAI